MRSKLTSLFSKHSIARGETSSEASGATSSRQSGRASRRQGRGRRGPSPSRSGVSGHVTAAELCEAVQALALRQFGSLAATVLCHWGVTSTSDIGDIVYNLIAAGDLEKTPSDSRSDFDDVFDFETAFKPKCTLATDDAD